MIRKQVRIAMALMLGLVVTTWSPAQEEVPPPKKAPTGTKAEQEAKAKAAYREKKAKAKAEADAKAKAAAVDINRASKEELMKVPGITEAYAKAIIANRPYHSKADLVTKKVLPNGTYQSIHKLVAAK